MEPASKGKTRVMGLNGVDFGVGVGMKGYYNCYEKGGAECAKIYERV